MRKREKEAVLVSFLKEKEKYERLADYIIQFIKDDPSSPRENFHTILYRLKEKKRLVEKIDEENRRLDPGAAPINWKNYQERIDDLLGIRLICLRLSDIDRIKAYLDLLADEKILTFIRKPDHKQSFVLPVDPGATIPQGLCLRYSGYSSIHYQVALGENSDAPEELKGLQVELQLRTILEEAWGEIDHKYRYAFSRSGVELPGHIHTGFYNLSAYLQAAALQAEHLCRQSEAHQAVTVGKEKTRPKTRGKTNRETMRADFSALMEKTFGFKPTTRTITYLLERLDEFGYAQDPEIVFQNVFTRDRLKEFRAIFREVYNREAFEEKSKRNLDAIHAVNFALSNEIQGSRVAKEGLRAILRRKTKRSR